MGLKENIKNTAREGYLWYRDNLAYQLKELRKNGNKELAETLLESEKNDEKSFKKYLKESNRWTIDILDNKLTHKYTDTHIATYILENLDRFAWCTHTDIINKMFEVDPSWRGSNILYNLDKFQWIDYNDVLDKEITSIAKINMYRSYGVRIKTSKLRGEFKGIDEIIECKDKFKWISDEDFVKKLMEHWYADDVARNVGVFKWLSEDTLKSIILWCKDIKSCPSSDLEWWDQILTETLIDNGEYEDLSRRLFHGKLKWLKPETANHLIELWKWHMLVKGLWFQCFEWLDYQVTVEKLIEFADPEWEKNNYLGDLVDLLTIKNKVDWYAKGKQIFGHFEPARYMNDKKLATKKTLHDYSQLNWLDCDRIMNKLIECWHFDYIPRLMYKLKTLSHNELATKMIDKNEEAGCKVIAKNLKSFRWLSRETAEKLIDNWYWKDVVVNPKSFEWLDFYKVAKKLLEFDEESGCHIIIENFKNFEKLDKDIWNKLAKNWYSDIVVKNPKKFWLKNEQ